MKIVIAGGTGFLGRPLSRTLAADGHDIVVLTRSRDARGTDEHIRLVPWTPDGDAGSWASEINGASAVVNLAGESLSRRWTASRKERILSSRVEATRSIVAAIQRATAPPSLLVSGSAVGYYGPRGDEIVTERSAPGSDFLADVCKRWEAEAARASSDRTRVVFVRTGLVLARDGGALPPLLLPFTFGVGGRAGSGRQYWPWIHRADWIALVRWAIQKEGLSGALNATAPEPVTNAEFSRALGRAMHRPAFMPAPAFALRLLLGEMAQALVLTGQRVVPDRATSAGFRFKYPKLDAALDAVLAA